MTVRTEMRCGRRRLVIDIKYRNPDGTRARFRRDAEVQTLASARAEERRRLVWLATTGTPEHGPELAAPRASASTPIATPVKGSTAPTFAVVVGEYLDTFAPSHLKPSTRYGYEIVLRATLVPELGETAVDRIDAAAVRRLDVRLVREGARPSTRRNVQAILRSVLCRFAVEAGYLDAPPSLPRLPKVGATVVRAMTESDLAAVLASTSAPYVLPFMLAAFAGLRAGEVRGLRWRDVDLDRGRIVVRQSICRGVAATPKSGHERIIPLVPELQQRLGRIEERPRDAFVTSAADGSAWSQFALLNAFRRAVAKAGLEGWRFHDLRHFFVTTLFRGGAPAPAVQALAGHSDLATTQRYAHVGVGDLEAAIDRLRGNGVVTRAVAAVDGVSAASEN